VIVVVAVSMVVSVLLSAIGVEVGMVADAEVGDLANGRRTSRLSSSPSPPSPLAGLAPWKPLWPLEPLD
jgi:hypothetical protein